MLCYGAAIRSGLFGSGSTEVQKFIVTELLNNTKTRSYLPLLTYKFLTEGIDSVSIYLCFTFSLYAIYHFNFLF